MNEYNRNDNKEESEKIYMNIFEETTETESVPEREQEKNPFFHERIKKKRNSGFRKLIAVCLIVSIAGGGSIGAGYSWMQNKLNVNQEQKNMDTVPFASGNYLQTSSSQKSADSNSSIQIVKDVFPSVVSITTKVQGSRPSFFSGYSIPYETAGAGSGIIFYEDETKVYIATNNHVVENANEVGISMTGIKTDTVLVPAKVIGTDSTSDLAVISVLKSDLSQAGVDDYRVATFGNSDNLEVGESVIAIGNALGEGKTATGGMVSALGKEINIDGKKLQVIQTDAAINPGNSGGALVNFNGEVIGINTAKSYDAAVEGMGYAMPSNVILPIIEKLLKDGSVPRPYLGIVGADVTEQVAELYGGLPLGVLVRDVVDGGSADVAGIQSGDIITEFAGQKILTMDSLVAVLAEQEVGAVVEMKIIRNGEQSMTLKVTIQDANN